MIINTSKVQMVLENKAISAYTLEAETGVSRDTIAKLRRGLVKFENMKLKTLMQIQEWINAGNYKIGYDYAEMLEELHADIEEGLVGDFLYIVRGDYIEALEIEPIVDYYYSPEEIEDTDIAQKIRTSAVIAEMEQASNLFG